MATGKWKIAAFYRFFQIADCERFAAEIYQWGHDGGLVGTVILAPEGINGTVAGQQGSLPYFLEKLKKTPGLGGMELKFAEAPFAPFARFKVKQKPEIVTFRQQGLNPPNQAGIPVEPDSWDSLISREDITLIDTRNHYETAIGMFTGAQDPRTEDFTAFSSYVDSHLDPKTNPAVALYCTGGIRCEKATAYLREKGFKEVYHLRGGILNYLEYRKQQGSGPCPWEGDCFVFDERIAVDASLKPAGYRIDPETRLPEKISPGPSPAGSNRSRKASIQEVDSR